MEVEGELEYTPEVKELLYQQVEEQSIFCDIIIQHGQWRKKFHWCILAQSSFFECLHRCKWKETRTGVVTLGLGDPLIVEETVMYLYDKQPTLTKENVEGFLEMSSEFFLLQNLKYSCVRFLRGLIITEEKLRLIELSQLYGYDDTDLYDFIMAHLPVALQQEPATRLTTESVKDILTDPHLSYFTVQDKFIFITKWADSCEQNAKEFPQVFDAIDIGEVDKEFLETVILPHPLVVRMKYQVTPNMITPTDHRVICFPEGANGERIVCFDLDNDQWRVIDAKLPDYICSNEECQKFPEECTPIAGVSGPMSSDIFKIHSHRPDYFEIFKQDLKSRHTSIYQVVSATKSISEELDINKLCFSKTIFATVVHDYMYQKRPLSPPPLPPKRAPPQHPPTRQPNNQTSAIPKGSQQVIKPLPRRPLPHYVRLDTATLLIRQLDNPCPEMLPIISIKGHQIISLCVNSVDTVALLSELSLYLYDIQNGRIDVLPLDACLDRRNMKLVVDEDGFIIYDKRHVITICRSGEKHVAQGYSMHKYDIPLCVLPNDAMYFYSGKIWLRFLPRNDGFEYSSLEHSELIKGTGQAEQWKPLPFQANTFRIVSHAIDRDQVFMIMLTKSIGYCHVKCPHCPKLKSSLYLNVEEDSEEEYERVPDIDDELYQYIV